MSDPMTTPATGTPNGRSRVSERIEVVDGAAMYRISNVDQMDPFLMTIISSSDLWMFVSSSGGLTAGRVEPADCLFPYETVDRLHGGAGRVGPITVLRVRTNEGTTIWEPFTGTSTLRRRSLFKSLLGDALVLEEEHLDLGLTVRYRWAPSERFGWVRTVSLDNQEVGSHMSVDIVDGLLNIMPWGIDVALQQQMSNLANAYRRSEIVEPGLGIYSLEARIVDRPEPSQALRATTVWTTGLKGAVLSVDSEAVEVARRGQAFGPSPLRTGRPGSFLLNAAIDLDPGQTHQWHIVADVAQSHSDIVGLAGLLRSDDDLAASIRDDIGRSSSELWEIAAGADGCQFTSSAKTDAHHLANTLFNVMRGGTFLPGYAVEKARFRAFVKDRHRGVAARHAEWLDGLPESLDVQDLRAHARGIDDPNLARLADEYLPIGFSRRHGDPSRPWNHFEIRVRGQHGEPLLSYQGNWRDIFQNWEALCRSFPNYLPSIIAKFLNASTADGFNPYRITSEGIDWEVPEPDNPWSGIGYWGDHQIVYLLRLLEAQEAHRPGWLATELDRTGYAFADVPYRIVPYDRLVQNPKATVDYDEGTAAMIRERVAAIGTDGKLATDAAGDVIHVTFLEKLLVPMLAKLSNFVPGGGIWMNTERPEWNDANNALVGWGLSMVTLSYLRRYVEFLDGLLADRSGNSPVSPEVIRWVEALTRTLESADKGPGDPGERARVLHELGTAYDAYRSAIYEHGPSPSRPLEYESVRRLCHSARLLLDASIRAARRDDGLYDAYNLLRLSPDGSQAHIEQLSEMLEGQVAAISSGLLEVSEVVGLLRAMYASALYREDVNSFLLYPATPPAPFLERNRVPPEPVEANPLLTALLDAGSGEVIVRDLDGDYRFNSDFHNAWDLETALDGLSDGGLGELAKEHRAATLDLFEQVFHHHGFTGRSSTMYAFEGIGSIYWHMVAKLLVAVQESILSAPASASNQSLEELVALYYQVREGLGFNKSAADYGAFPTDPYSHTPAHAGAQQPGMTGQVKEELLTRWADLGLTVARGAIRFTPLLLNDRDFGSESGELVYLDVNRRQERRAVGPHTAAFTLCQVPIVVHTGEFEPRMIVTHEDGTEREIPGWSLDEETSMHIFGRTGRITLLTVFAPRSSVRELSS
ncbi:MAG: hypothetical protein OEP52_11475 [Acidimicrobiia bacterium]|nr:hypothetical protein [Acidimicrobiia bacterium]